LGIELLTSPHSVDLKMTSGERGLFEAPYRDDIQITGDSTMSPLFRRMAKPDVIAILSLKIL
jgi:hypothetical protein